MCDSSVRLSLVRSLQLHLTRATLHWYIVVVATKPRQPLDWTQPVVKKYYSRIHDNNNRTPRPEHNCVL